MINTKFKINISSGFKESIEKAIQNISRDQDEIEIPNSGGQMLVRKGTPAEEKRKDLKKKARCFPYEKDGEHFLVCVR
jgi:hypothetical protein